MSHSSVDVRMMILISVLLGDLSSFSFPTASAMWQTVLSGIYVVVPSHLGSLLHFGLACPY
jgi:hypothetical protein